MDKINLVVWDLTGFFDFHIERFIVRKIDKKSVMTMATIDTSKESPIRDKRWIKERRHGMSGEEVSSKPTIAQNSLET